MNTQIFGLAVPFLGTFLGSACVFLLKNELNKGLQKALNGFAGGIMLAASVWSLIIPSIESSEALGRFQFIPAVVGFLVGIAFLLVLDKMVERLVISKGASDDAKKNAMLMLAVTLHNIPEGMAVGVALVGALSENASIPNAVAITLSTGIAIQNFPEGAIISMPLSAGGESKGKSFLMGALSGAVEPIAAVLTLALAGFVIPILPYVLSFAAGAMVYVVIMELVPEMQEEPRSSIGIIALSLGFCIMMALDVALG